MVLARNHEPCTPQKLQESIAQLNRDEEYGAEKTKPGEEDLVACQETSLQQDKIWIQWQNKSGIFPTTNSLGLGDQYTIDQILSFSSFLLYFNVSQLKTEKLDIRHFYNSVKEYSHV